MSAEPEDLIVLALNKENNNKILVTHELRVWENGKNHIVKENRSPLYFSNINFTKIFHFRVF